MTRFLGERVRRIEDHALLRGEALFGDDLCFPGLLHGCFVRSPHAHARIATIETSAASALPGVHAVLTCDDLSPVLAGERVPVHMPGPGLRHRIDPFVLSRDEVCHVGEPVALVLAASRHVAEDAAECVTVDYEPLAAVADPRAALAASAPVARSDLSDNLAARIELGYGDCEAAFTAARHRIHEQFRIHKGGGHALETRAVVAVPDRQCALLTVYDSTQMPHRAHAILCAALGLAESRLRVVAPAVGGGFGPKSGSKRIGNPQRTSCSRCRYPPSIWREYNMSTVAVTGSGVMNDSTVSWNSLDGDGRPLAIAFVSDPACAPDSSRK